VGLCSVLFLLLALVDAQYVFIPCEGVFNDQYFAAQLLERFGGGGDSFWRALVEGRLPVAHPTRPSWHGVLMAYLYMPFHLLFGASWELARYWCHLFAVGSLLFTYGFMRRVYGPGAALLALFLIVIHPGYVMMIRTGSAFYSPMHFFSCGCLYFASLWWDSRRHVFFALAVVMIGLGLSTMLWFGWFAAGLAVGAVLLAKPIFVRLRLREWKSTLHLVVAGGVGAMVGSAMMLYREWTGESNLLAKVSSDLGGGLDVYLANVPLAWATLTETWWAFSANAWFGSNASANEIYPWAVVAAVGVAAVLAVLSSVDQPRLLLPVVLVVMLVQAPLALRSVETALFFLYPLPQMVLAAAIVGVGALINGRKLQVSALVLLVLFVGAELRSLGASVSLLRARVESGAHLNPVYHLAVWLREEHPVGRRLFLNKMDALEPYLYFFQPERGLVFETASANELIGRLGSEPAGGSAEAVFVYGIPGPRPEVLSSESGHGIRVEKIVEFSHEKFSHEFPPVRLRGHGDGEQNHFGPPVTVYRLRQ